ncbi:MAG: hypothetical protein HY791_33265 [Deltaproteobacteria bacterium]|nr:hypothetical protein [Deltaproteobacteria bacterium]
MRVHDFGFHGRCPRSTRSIMAVKASFVKAFAAGIFTVTLVELVVGGRSSKLDLSVRRAPSSAAKASAGVVRNLNLAPGCHSGPPLLRETQLSHY